MNTFKFNNAMFKFILVVGFVALFELPSLEAKELTSDWQMLYEKQKELIANKPLRLPQIEDTVHLRDLNEGKRIRIDGLSPIITLGFGSRLDQHINSAEIELSFEFSPTLVEEASQLRIHFNQELIGAIQLKGTDKVPMNSYKFKVPAEYFSEYNELQLELIGESIGWQCSIVSTATWVEFDQRSHFKINKTQLVRSNDLAWFPEPFFDKRDFNSVSLHYLLPKKITPELTKAAGILSSYFGSKADWREVNHQSDFFEVEPKIDLSAIKSMEDEQNPLKYELLPKLPEQHLIAFITNDNKPWQLHDLEAVETPTIRMLTNPDNRIYKLLVVQGADESQLIQAIQYLVSEDSLLSDSNIVAEAVDLQPRAAYSAPKWLKINKVTRFSELVNFSTDLQRTGYKDKPIQINLAFPPDLFIQRKANIPIDLKFRYSPPIQVDESRMRVLVNDEFVQGYTLDETGLGGDNTKLRIPVIGYNPFAKASLEIPSFKLGVLNSLEFEFSFSALTEQCKIRPLANTTGAIDGDSSIDLRGYEHYVKMPNLHLFTQSGYPFTRYDDLSNTLLLVSEKQDLSEFNFTMDLLAYLGSVTGYYGKLVTISTVDNAPNKTNKDILIVGQQALSAWFERFGTKGVTRFLSQAQTSDFKELLTHSGGESNKNKGLLVSFESPLKRGATVVAVSASGSEKLLQTMDFIKSTDRTASLMNHVAIISEQGDQFYETQEVYYVGQMRLLSRLYFHLARYPLLVALVSLFSLITLVFIIYWFFTQLSAHRMPEDND